MISENEKYPYARRMLGYHIVRRAQRNSSLAFRPEGERRQQVNAGHRPNSYRCPDEISASLLSVVLTGVFFLREFRSVGRGVLAITTVESTKLRQIINGRELSVSYTIKTVLRLRCVPFIFVSFLFFFVTKNNKIIKRIEAKRLSHDAAAFTCRP